MNIDAVTPSYLPTLTTPPPQPEPAADKPEPSRDFSFKIGGHTDTESGFTKMIKAAQAGDVLAKQEVERLNESAGQSCCGSC